jgi:hypothetical protein
MFILDISFFKYVDRQNFELRESQKQYGEVPESKYFFKLRPWKETYSIEKHFFRPVMNSESKENPVVIFGCSYAYGYVFDNDQTISYALSKYSKRPIINRAKSGWGIQHMLYQLKEDKEFTSSIKPPKYVIYVLMDSYNHYERLYYTSFSSVIDYYFGYKERNGKFIERKPFLGLYYNFVIFRFIQNEIIQKIVLHYCKNPKSMVYDRVTKYFIETQHEIQKNWGNKNGENPKFIILALENNNIEYYKEDLEEQGIDVIEISKLIGIKDLQRQELEFYEPEIGGHPNGKLWEVVIPKLKEIYKDM